MSTLTTRVDWTKVAPAWESLRQATHIGPIRNDAHYDEMVRLLDELIDEVRDDEDNPLAALLELVGGLIERYEDTHEVIPEAPPQEALRFLMDEHGLKQSDLSEIGSQGVVSEVLAGRRHINARQAKALAARFNVSPAVFL
jgi:HTH-type transcriptional regulator/antitoxin HigA